MFDALDPIYKQLPHSLAGNVYPYFFAVSNSRSPDPLNHCGQSGFIFSYFDIMCEEVSLLIRLHENIHTISQYAPILIGIGGFRIIGKATLIKAFAANIADVFFVSAPQAEF